MKRWTSISPTNEEYRWQLFSRYLKDLGVANEYVPWTGDSNDVEDISELDPFDHVRLSSSIGPRVLKKMKVQSGKATMIGVIDGMSRTEHGWWPLCAMYEAMTQILIHFGQTLDARGSVLIAGAGGTARLAVGAFFKAGFSKFLLTNYKPEEADEFIREVRSRLFGLQIEWIPMERIVLLPGESAVLVNSTPSSDDNALLVELSYLNFLKRPGIVVDLNRVLNRSLLVQEALDAGVTVVDGFEVAARSDALWCQWAFGVEMKKWQDYREELKSTLKG